MPASPWMGSHVTEESSGRLEGFLAFAARRGNHGGKRSFSPFLTVASLSRKSQRFCEDLSKSFAPQPLPPITWLASALFASPFLVLCRTSKDLCSQFPYHPLSLFPLSNPYLATPCLSRFISDSPPSLRSAASLAGLSKETVTRSESALPEPMTRRWSLHSDERKQKQKKNYACNLDRGRRTGI